MPQFSSHESVSLEKGIELKGKLIQTSDGDVNKIYEVERCAEWIKKHGFKKVCLQFPDHLLPDSSDVALKLQDILDQTVYILGDTAYESCCIDYVAAAHINSDAIIHFGPICFSKTLESIPCLYVYEKCSINLDDFENIFSDRFRSLGPHENVMILLDDGYIHCYENVCSLLKSHRNLEIHKVDEEKLDLSNKNVIYVGNNLRKLLNIDLTFKPKILYHFDPTTSPPDITEYKLDSKIIKRRYFLMEKIRDANTIGIVIGTLAVKNYLEVIERVKKLVEVNGKKYYLISVGKPTVAKLANLGEVDIYVVVTCSMNDIYDSRDYYKPIVTPFDIEMALNSNPNNSQFTYDYNRYLSNLDDIATFENETDVSLLTGKLRYNGLEQTQLTLEEENNSQLALKSEGTVAVSSNFGAGFLNERTWKGLEPNLGQTEVKMAERGRTGIAQGYENENF